MAPKRMSDAHYEECQTRLDELLLCDCCGIDGRHTKNKPAIYAPWIESKPWEEITQSEAHACKCNCRSEARMICRGHPDWRGPVYPDKKIYLEKEIATAQSLLNMAATTVWG